MNLTKEQVDKFFTHFTVSRIEYCWEWNGTHDKNGYGRYLFEGKTVAAHKFMYEHKHGPVPKGEFVHHSCDCRDCVNHNHLFACSMKDYHKRMKGLGGTNQPSGSAVKISKLQESDIPQIKRLKAEGLSQAEIAAQFGVSQVTISKILAGKTWTKE